GPLARRRCIPAGRLLPRIGYRGLAVALHRRLPGERLARLRAVARAAREARRWRTLAARERHAAVTWVRVLEPGRAVAGRRVSGRGVAGPGGRAALGWVATRSGVPVPRGKGALLGEPARAGEHPLGLRRLGRIP